MKFRSILFPLALTGLFACTRLQDGKYTLVVLTMNDVHGAWFDSSYVDGKVKESLFAVNYYVDSVRRAEGADHVILLDAGDCLQGDNAAYYYNYVDTKSPHLYPRLMEYMKCDAVAIGNHDIEAGHPVYDRVAKELKERGIDMLGGNYIRNDDGKPYFPLYRIVNRAGLRVAIMGYGNANIKAWLSEDVWEGMHFERIAEVIQKDVDSIKAREKPDVVIAVMHTASGLGDGTIAESEALDVLNSVRGVDFVICGHDHKPYVETRDTCALINTGSRSRFVGYGRLELEVKDGDIVSRSYEAKLIPVNPRKADPAMKEHFKGEFEAVKAFTLREMGVLMDDFVTRDSYLGMCPYIDFIHYVELVSTGADISFAAPLTYDGRTDAGTLIYNDLFTIYPYENQLYKVPMTGRQVREYLERSYDDWIQNPSEGHVLKIVRRDDPRNSQKSWSFSARSYNFDSAGGLFYTVDVTKPRGQRVSIASMADGTPFDEDRTYTVAMTSYRANGGGDLLKEGAGIEDAAPIIIERYPEIRSLIYDYLLKEKVIDPGVTSDPGVIGRWKFVPENVAGPAMERDLDLLFP